MKLLDAIKAAVASAVSQPDALCEDVVNPHVEDFLYRIVGEEVARNELHPGSMARAVAESKGDNSSVRSLYITFRVKELYREYLRDAAAERLLAETTQQQVEEERKALRKLGEVT